MEIRANGRVLGRSALWRWPVRVPPAALSLTKRVVTRPDAAVLMLSHSPGECPCVKPVAKLIGHAAYGYMPDCRPSNLRHHPLCE